MNSNGPHRPDSDEPEPADESPIEFSLDDPDGQRAIFEKYSSRLSRLASRHISQQMARRFDDEDILQSTFRSFFRRYDRGEFEIQTEQQLWRLLVKMTLCKTRTYARQHSAQKRDVRMNQRLESIPPISGPNDDAPELMALWEEVDRALSGLPELAETILFLRLDGETKTGIAERLDISRQTVHRTLKLIHQRMTAQLDQYQSESRA